VGLVGAGGRGFSPPCGARPFRRSCLVVRKAGDRSVVGAQVVCAAQQLPVRCSVKFECSLADGKNTYSACRLRTRSRF